MSLLINLQNTWTTFAVSAITLAELPFRVTPREQMNARIYGWAQALCDHAKIDLQVEGIDDLKLEPGGRYVVMSNHASYYDIPVTMTVFKHIASIRMIAKAELFKVPIWGPAMRRAEILSIDRDDRKQAALDIALAKSKLEEGVMLWISPEGTRTRDGKLLDFKAGGFKLAMDMEAQIIPMGLQGVEKVMPADGIKVVKNQQVTARIGQPVDTKGLARNQRKELMAQVREEIRRLAQLPPDDAAPTQTAVPAAHA